LHAENWIKIENLISFELSLLSFITGLIILRVFLAITGFFRASERVQKSLTSSKVNSNRGMMMLLMMMMMMMTLIMA
jgi:hypothetical protein